MSLISDLRHFIRRYDLLPVGARVVVGVSGGPDSLALLHVLHRLAPELGWSLHAAYLHHGVRAEAEAEARFVAEIAAAWGVGCSIERVDVNALAAQPGVSWEEAARQARYAFLGRVARRLGANHVAVGHHADDQAESVLMHLLRGSGLAGLRGMLPRTRLAALRLAALPVEQREDFSGIWLVRPWLETPRAAIEAYCRDFDLQPRYDASNTDTTFFRNRLRHEILPVLRQINPRLTTTLGRTARSLQGDYATLARRRRRLWQELAQVEAAHVRLQLSAFRRLAVGEQRGLVRQALAHLRPDLRNINWEHSEGLLALLAADAQRASGGPYPLVAGIEAWLNDGWLDIGLAQARVSGAPEIAQPLVLPLPGEVALGPTWQLAARLGAWPAAAPHPHVLWLPVEIAQPLMVRSRRPGDRMRGFGMTGSKAITDWMTELRLPRAARPGWPLVVDGRDEILWVVGQRASEACRVPDNADAVWELRLLRSAETAEDGA